MTQKWSKITLKWPKITKNGPKWSEMFRKMVQIEASNTNTKLPDLKWQKFPKKYQKCTK